MATSATTPVIVLLAGLSVPAAAREQLTIALSGITRNIIVALLGLILILAAALGARRTGIPGIAGMRAVCVVGIVSRSRKAGDARRGACPTSRSDALLRALAA